MNNENSKSLTDNEDFEVIIHGDLWVNAVPPSTAILR